MATSDAEATVEFAINDAIIGNFHRIRINPEDVEKLAGIIKDEMFKKAVRWAAKAYADELDLLEVKVGHQQQRD